MVPNDIRNPASRRIRAGRRKRADWAIVAPFDPVFFFNYSEIKVFVKRAVAFVDGQNLFHTARKLLECQYPDYHPLALAQAIC